MNEARGRLMRTLAIAVVAVAVAVAIGCGDDDDSTSAGDDAATTAAAETTAEAPEPEVTKLAQAGATKVQTSGDWLAAGEGAVWLSDRKSIRRLNPESGKPEAEIPVDAGPCSGIDVGFGAVWTETCLQGGLARIDPATDTVDHVRLDVPRQVRGGESSIGAGEGGVWLVVDGHGCEACSLAKVDPKTMKVSGEVPVEPGAAGVRVGYGSVWVTNPDADVLQQVDPGSLEILGTYEVGESPRYLAVGEGGVWTLNQVEGSITHVDPETGEVVATIPAELVGAGGDITTGAGSVWAKGTYTTLVRIDPKADQVVEKFDGEGGSGSVVVDSGAVWISAHLENVLWRLPLD
jgi:virginiamycin B lyase